MEKKDQVRVNVFLPKTLHTELKAFSFSKGVFMKTMIADLLDSGLESMRK